jgi:potassium voltage-gated channel Eag-related subfamily H protein 8
VSCTKLFWIDNIFAYSVYKAVKTLKNQKACGTDGINNEMLKLACSMHVDIFVKVFNLILKSEVYPELWRENYIKPVFKGGCLNNPSNYRGLALSSCFEKFFSKILHNMLDSFIENNNILYKGQIGFRKGCRTSDHIFTLKTLIDKAFRSTKRLYACFVDLKNAFDTVNRGTLIYKLSCLGIKANFLNIMKNMYREDNYCVRLEEGITDKLSSQVGVKQGCILIPTLFSLYINDLIQSLDIGACDSPALDNELIPCLLYADDIVLLSESAEGLQHSLNALHHYCNKWDLRVNIDKTKVIIFNKSGRLFKNVHFIYYGNSIECVNEFKYLGILFKPSGSFSAAVDLLCKKAIKVVFSIRRSLFS